MDTKLHVLPKLTCAFFVMLLKPRLIICVEKIRLQFISTTIIQYTSLLDIAQKVLRSRSNLPTLQAPPFE